MEGVEEEGEEVEMAELGEVDVDDEAEMEEETSAKEMQDMIIVQTPPGLGIAEEGDSSASERTDQGDIVEDGELEPDQQDDELEAVEGAKMLED